MSNFSKIFTWWDGSTFGTWLTFKRRGSEVGSDALGNRYFEISRGKGLRPRRWVLYAGSNDASLVTPQWHGWLHGALEDLPGEALPAPRPWAAEPQANLTGTVGAYHPAGAIGDGSMRASARGDYEAWTPE